MTQKVEQITEYLVYGYIREFESNMEDIAIPIDINLVCVKFYGLLIDIESQLLTDSAKSLLVELLNAQFGINTLKQIKLLYNSKQDGETYKEYASKCFNKPKTITIVKTADNQIFGGYTAIPWQRQSGYKSDSSAFLFALEIDKYHIFPVQKKLFAVYHYHDTFGPWFGRGDVIIWVQYEDRAPFCDIEWKDSYSNKDSNSCQFISDTKHQNIQFEMFQLS